MRGEPNVVGSVVPSALDARTLSHLMTAFAQIEGVWCDVAQDDDVTMLVYFVAGDEMDIEQAAST